MDRLRVLCFAGMYGLALVAELARVVVRAHNRPLATPILTAVGWVVQAAYLARLAWVQQTLPVTTLFESMLVLSWILAGIALYLMLRSPKNAAVGLFALPIALGLLIYAGLDSSTRGSGWSDWRGRVAFWGTVHGVFLLAGAVSTCLAFVAGLMYLAQLSRLKRKQSPARGISLPSLEQSERLNRGAIMFAFPLLTLGLFIGVILALASRGDGGVRLALNDPKVLSGAVMWLVFAALLNARFRPSMRGRRVVVLTMVAFAFLVFAWVGVDLLRLPTGHGGPRVSPRGPQDAGRTP